MKRDGAGSGGSGGSGSGESGGGGGGGVVTAARQVNALHPGVCRTWLAHMAGAGAADDRGPALARKGAGLHRLDGPGKAAAIGRDRP